MDSSVEDEERPPVIVDSSSPKSGDTSDIEISADIPATDGLPFSEVTNAPSVDRGIVEPEIPTSNSERLKPISPKQEIVEPDSTSPDIYLGKDFKRENAVQSANNNIDEVAIVSHNGMDNQHYRRTGTKVTETVSANGDVLVTEENCTVVTDTSGVKWEVSSMPEISVDKVDNSIADDVPSPGRREVGEGAEARDVEEGANPPPKSSASSSVPSNQPTSPSGDKAVGSSSKHRGHTESKSHGSHHDANRRHSTTTRKYHHSQTKSSSHNRSDTRSHSSRSGHSSRCASKREGRRCDCSYGRHRSGKSYTDNVRIQVNYEDIVLEMSEKRKQKGGWIPPKKERIPWTPHPHINKLRHRKYFRIQVDPNGGASVCHLYWDEISHFSDELKAEIALQFIKLSYSEDANECAYHVIGIVHGAAEYLPDLVDYMADHYGSLLVQIGSLTGRETQSITMAEYRDQVYRTYCNGTFRFAPLQELSICGVQREEVGAYIPDFVRRLESSPCMKPVMPWSKLSFVATDNPRESNDGPIFWVRPGEQTLPSSDRDRSKGRIAKGVARLSEAREALFEDRTKPHADQIGIDGGATATAPTAAVGVLKAVKCGHKEHGFRATKDVVAFDAKDYVSLIDLLQLDVYEPPLRQCRMWMEVGKLNSLRRAGVRYAHFQLQDNDVYYIPRKVVHQFQSISAVASVAWHIRWKDYFLTTGAPNLHAPPGLNKGSVYYEKKNVPVYVPPDVIEPFDYGDEEEYKTPRKSDKSPKTPKSSARRRARAASSLTPEKSEKIKKHPVHTLTKPQASETSKKAAEERTSTDKPSETSASHQTTPSSKVDTPIKQEQNEDVVSEEEQESHPTDEIAATDSTQTTGAAATTTEAKAAVDSKPLKENVFLKKRKVVYDVVGDIMAQMKRSKP